jgi:hypothetical protein
VLSPGEIVQGPIGWQSHPRLRAEQLEKLDLDLGGPLDWIGHLVPSRPERKTSKISKGRCE